MAQTFQISGRVVDRRSRKGIAGLRVEAWDKDTKYHDMLDVATTSSTGAFRMQFDDKYYGDYAPDRWPDLFFKIFQGQRLLKSTIEEPMTNLRESRLKVTLEVDMPVVVTDGKDRVTTQQAFGMVGFLRRSDFRGVGRETGAKFSAVGNFLGDALAKGFADWDYAPLRPTQTRTTAIVGQNENLAREHLALNGVEINEVSEYQPAANAESLKLATRMPVNLKEGDKVNLYVQNGTVKYYTVVPAPETTDVNAEEIAGLKQELAQAREDSARKDEVINGLKRDVEKLRTTQTDMSTRFSPERLTGLEEQLADIKRRLG